MRVYLDPEKLITLRHKKGLSQNALAELSKTSRATVGRSEKGTGAMYPETLKRLADALDVPPDELLLARGSPTSAQTAQSPLSPSRENRGMVVSSGGRIPHDQPPSKGNLIGRKGELEKIITALQLRQSVALVSGMGGIGKTTLATAAMQHLVQDGESFPCGYTWIRCDQQHGLDGLRAIYDEVLAKWRDSPIPRELPQTTTAEDEVAARELALQTRVQLAGAAFILLDNVEPDIPVLRLIGQLEGLGFTVLMTSQYHPLLVDAISLDVLTPEQSVELFVQSYTDSGKTWDTQRDRADTAFIIERLGELPLAIELAAKRAARVGIAQIVAELPQAKIFTLLKDPIDAKTSVRYSLKKSLAILKKPQRMRFAALSLPQGPSIPYNVVIEMFAAMYPQARQAPLEDIDTFEALSLITREGEQPYFTRIRLHPLLRDLAAEKWQDAEEALQGRAIQGLIKGVSHYVSKYQFDDVQLELDAPLIRGASLSVWVSKSQGTDFFTMLKVLKTHIDTRARFQFGEELYVWASELAQSQGEDREAAIALSDLGTLCYVQGEFERAEEYFRASLAIAYRLQDSDLVYENLIGLSSLVAETGEYEKSLIYYDDAKQLAKELGDDALSAGLRYAWGYTIGYSALFLGKLEEAQKYYEKVIQRVHDLGNEVAETHLQIDYGIVLHLQAMLAFHRQRKLLREDVEYQAQLQEMLKKNIAFFKKVLHQAKRIGSQFGIAAASYHLGRFARMRGRYSSAKRYFGRAMPQFKEMRYQALKPLIINDQGIFAFVQRNYPEAVNRYQEALALVQRNKHHLAEALILLNLSNVPAPHIVATDSALFREQADKILKDQVVPKEYLNALEGMMRLPKDWMH